VSDFVRCQLALTVIQA